MNFIAQPEAQTNPDIHSGFLYGKEQGSHTDQRQAHTVRNSGEKQGFFSHAAAWLRAKRKLLLLPPSRSQGKAGHGLGEASHQASLLWPY